MGGGEEYGFGCVGGGDEYNPGCVGGGGGDANDPGWASGVINGSE